MKNLKIFCLLLLPVLFFGACNADSELGVGNGNENGKENGDDSEKAVTNWKNFSVQSGAAGIEYKEFEGKTGVLFIAPKSENYGTEALKYSRSLVDYPEDWEDWDEEYTEEKKITVTMTVWAESPAEIVWKAGDHELVLTEDGGVTTGKWITLTGDITVILGTNDRLALSGIELDGASIYIAACTVTVTGKDVPVRGITLEKSVLTLLIDESEKLNYTIRPAKATNRNVTWTSGAPAVVSVTGDGTVKAESEGDALITVKTEEGEYEATIKVYVTATELPVTGIKFDQSGLTLTMFEKQKPAYTITPANAFNQDLTWTSGAPAVVSVTDDGTVKALSYTSGANDTNSANATGTATVTVKTADGDFEASITVTTTMVSRENVQNLPPMKDQFADYFMIGNIGNGTGLQRHYNIVTSENGMKPDQYGGSVSGTTVTGLTFTNPNNFVNTAISRGFKVHGHVLLWHSQVPGWQRTIGTGSTSVADATAIMKDYITKVVTNFKGKLHSWDVLNEVFPDGVSATANWRNVMRTTGDSQNPNPWYQKIGADFVYEVFKAARLADPVPILYYNDYNMDSVGKSAMVRDMVRDVNNQWKDDPEYDGRLLIEGIGMQSHHNTNVSAANVEASLARFRELGVKISISELDVLGYPYSGSSPSYSPNRDAPYNSGKLSAANLYGQYFDLFLANADIIERVTFWGLYDSASWRRQGLPLPFDGDATGSRAKPAYYKIIESLEKQLEADAQ